MASKPDTQIADQTSPEDRGRFWQPPEKRLGVSAEGRKWQAENAEAIAEWNAWVEKHGLPIPPMF